MPGSWGSQAQIIVGFWSKVEVGFSERSLSLEAARPVAQASGINNVILLCNHSLEFARQVATDFYPHAIQLQCQKPPDFVAKFKLSVQCQIWKAIHLPIASDQPTVTRYIGAAEVHVDIFCHLILDGWNTLHECQSLS